LGFPGEGASNDGEDVDNGNFLAFSHAISSETLEIRPASLYTDKQSFVGFSVIPKCMTLNCYFALNSVFMQVWLALTRRLSKNNCVKISKDRHIVSAMQIFGKDSSFWQYKVCADIHSGSLEKRCYMTVGSCVNALLEHLFLAFETTAYKKA